MTSEPMAPSPPELYEEFYGPAIFRPLARILLDYAAPRPGERVLDLACGTGIVARMVAPHVGNRGQVTAIDINANMVAVGRKLPSPEGATIDWREGDAGALDLPDRSFDLVLCQQGLQFFPDRPAALAEVRRILAPGGRVALAVWQSLERQTLYGSLAEIELRHLGPLDVGEADVKAPFLLGDEEELRSLLRDAGFTELEVVDQPFEARFPDPESFVERSEVAYAAVIPRFAEDPAAFAAYLEAVSAEARPLVERYRDGEKLSFPMPTHIAVARG